MAAAGVHIEAPRPREGNPPTELRTRANLDPDTPTTPATGGAATEGGKTGA